MSQRTNIIYNFINNPLIYMLVQKIMSGTSFRKKIIKQNIKNNKFKVLDVGCGPAEILEYMPNIIYHGYDIDSRSINYAKKKYKSSNYHFYCKKLTSKEVKKLPKFDYIILFGILHHLKNIEAIEILKLCKNAMKKKGMLLTEDPILTKNQNFIAKFLVSNDRGLNVRNKKKYLDLVNKFFKRTKTEITNQFFIPYTWFTMICRK